MPRSKRRGSRRSRRRSRSRSDSRNRSRSRSRSGSRASGSSSRGAGSGARSGASPPASRHPSPSPGPSSSPRERSPSPSPRSASPARDATTERACTYPRCAWRGPALWSHWWLAHGGALIGGRHTLDVPVRSPTKGLARGVAVTRLLRTRGRLFALHLRRRPGEASLLGCVQLLGTRPSGRSFVYRLEVLDGEDRPSCSVMSEITVSEETPIAKALLRLCEVPSRGEPVAASSAQPPTAPDSLRVQVHLRESPFARKRSRS